MAGMDDKSERQIVVVKRRIQPNQDKLDAKKMAEGLANHYGKKTAIDLLNAWISVAGGRR